MNIAKSFSGIIQLNRFKLVKIYGDTNSKNSVFIISTFCTICKAFHIVFILEFSHNCVLLVRKYLALIAFNLLRNLYPL